MAWLPDRLPEQSKPVWEKRLTRGGVGGLAATSEIVIVSDRGTDDSLDVWRGLSATTGQELWTLRYPAKGELDYGSSPRATPLLHDGRAYLLGAFGHLYCVDLKSGEVVWKRHIRQEFKATEKLVWGCASSPLIVDGKLIVNPGGREASLVALDPKTGETLWQTPGEPAAFASFISGEFGGQRQLIGYDKATLGGWDITTGKRLWTYKAPTPGDFNVPTPILVAGKSNRLLVTTEANGTRLFSFQNSGQLSLEPIAEYDSLAPDTHTPVLCGQRVLGVWTNLYCLDLSQELKPLWIGEDPIFKEYASLIASPQRLLVTGVNGELALLDPGGDKMQILSRAKPLGDDEGVLSHPAVVGSKLYLRGSKKVVCVELAP